MGSPTVSPRKGTIASVGMGNPTTLPNVEKCGNMIKRGEKRKNWKKRWFALTPDKLQYWKTQKGAEVTLFPPISLSAQHK